MMYIILSKAADLIQEISGHTCKLKQLQNYVDRNWWAGDIYLFEERRYLLMRDVEEFAKNYKGFAKGRPFKTDNRIKLNKKYRHANLDKKICDIVKKKGEEGMGISKNMVLYTLLYEKDLSISKKVLERRMRVLKKRRCKIKMNDDNTYVINKRTRI